jgi:hypothetical protein
MDRVNAVLLAGSALFVGYHAALGVDVMGMHARFYLPTLVPLALAGARGVGVESAARRTLVATGVWLASLLAWLALWHWPPVGRAERIAWPLLGAHAIAAVWVLLGLSWPKLRERTTSAVVAAALAAAVLAPAGPRLAELDDDTYVHAHIASGTVFRGLPQLVACLGDRIHVFHSEAGVPGLVIAHGKVTDLARLLNRAWLEHREPFDALCARERPEAIFLPHRNYRALNEEIAASHCLNDYTRVIEESASPLYVRNDLVGRYAGAMSDAD